MIPAIPSRLNLITVSCALALATRAIAHSDPLGDIYPNVRVERGNFVIDFKNNEGDDDSGERPRFRMIYSANGTLLSPRHPQGNSSDLDETLGYRAKNEAHLPNEVISFGRGGSDQPTYVLEKNRRKEEHRLAWPDDTKRTFEAVAADADSICVASITNESLFLHHFDRHRFKLPEAVQITAPHTLSFIWNFPVVSNLVQVNGRYCIAWPRYIRVTSRMECVISIWKPGEQKPTEIVLDGPADGNSHLSLAAIGDHLCLAYHCLAGENPLRSKITLVFRTIPSD